MENVKNLVSKKHKYNFDEWLGILEEYGYKNYWQVLNAKDYGIPQNRERVFVVSIRNDIDIDYKFPKSIILEKHLKDMLDDEVEEKFYLSEEQKKKFVYQENKGEKNQILSVGDLGLSYRSISRVLDPEGICSTLDTMQSKNRQPKVLIKNGTKKGYLEAEDGDGISLGYPNSKNRRGRVQKKISSTLDTTGNQGVLIFLKEKKETGRLGKQSVDTFNDNINNISYGDVIQPFNKKVKKDIMPTLTTRPEGLKTANIIVSKEYRIRKLTPRECWRLMGFKDEQFDKAEKVCSNTQLYKQAGNSIVVNVLEEIFKQMFLKGEKNE